MIPRDDGPLATTGETLRVNIGDATLPVMSYRTDRDGRRPTVLICPPGPLMGAFEPVEWIAARLRDAGLNAVTITYRQNSPEADVEDVAAVLDWLETQNFADMGAIGIMGTSRGGNAALRAAAHEPRIRAVATFGAVTDFLQQAFGTAAFAPSRHRMLTSWLGDPVTNRSFYERVQAIDCADRIKQPLLLLHGEHDMHSPVEQSIAVYEKARAAGNTQAQLELFPLMGHYGDVLPNGYAFNHLAGFFVPFMQEHLGA
jgi:dipeptidyl aminopeptidase/acylaminoacyl peptidase